jgi:hypothetical protein
MCALGDQRHAGKQILRGALLEVAIELGGEGHK